MASNVKTAPEAVIPADSMAADVYAGLTSHPKSLPPRLFYDAAGSDLFERITELDEYYLTRTERAILQAHAAEMVAAAAPPLSLIELGAGSATKTTIVIEALLRQQERAVYCPVDVSASALEMALAHLNGSFPTLQVRPIVADYSLGIAELSRLPGRKLVLYIGSSMGNFEPREAMEILRNLRKSLAPGDTLLLGLDMAKDPKVLLAAYDDADGVTAAFNKNMLQRINRELNGNFNLDDFQHVALWNEAESRIEMHLRSLKKQSVSIRALGLTVQFADSELLHTENSYKFGLPMVSNILKSGGFAIKQSWFDSNQWFGVHLAKAV